MDEADLLFSYGYRDDVVSLCALLPRVRQTVLMVGLQRISNCFWHLAVAHNWFCRGPDMCLRVQSATLSDDITELKQLTLRNPVVLKLDESDLPDQEQLKQYSLYSDNDDRYLYIYTLLKLKLVRGKTILFVNSINNCYKLKLFLEGFSIKYVICHCTPSHHTLLRNPL
jgi:ATP-dependent RNA helicase DDX56/DBP9